MNFILTILWNEVKADIIVFPEFQQNQVNYKIMKNVFFFIICIISTEHFYFNLFCS